KGAERVEISKVDYSLGSRYTENGVHYLYHSDVLDLFCRLLDRPKFRRVFADKYPLILIDEYQDSYKPLVDRFIEYFIAQDRGSQFGFFGDAWQTIYSSNNACGLIECEKLEVIQKNANFRSAPKIVDVLNRLRPELPQRSAVDGFEGEVYVVTCDDFKGERRAERAFQGDLPEDELKERLNLLNKRVNATSSPGETLKTLMITHKVLATQQGYDRLLNILDDGFRNKDDAFLLFFMNVVEPIYAALTEENTRGLFDALGVRRYPITRKSEKTQWKTLRQNLEEARERKTLDVLNVVAESKLVPIPPKVEEHLRRFRVEPDAIYVAKTSATLRDLFDLEYRQFCNAINFLRPESAFSTEHGVKGEEYDNVIFVISKGWNQYQFETYAPMITGVVAVPKGKEEAFERNRNLFYVSCSRAKKRLILFVSLTIDAKFRAFLTDLVGEKRVLTFGEFLALNG
ncbi:MAG: ATP-dependent helicase, partial [Thermoguttaceae bacterium]|nr:ATP-dependent helicase [Thermoguttaceae bacterium]